MIKNGLCCRNDAVGHLSCVESFSIETDCSVKFSKPPT